MGSFERMWGAYTWRSAPWDPLRECGGPTLDDPNYPSKLRAEQESNRKFTNPTRCSATSVTLSGSFEALLIQGKKKFFNVYRKFCNICSSWLHLLIIPKRGPTSICLLKVYFALIKIIYTLYVQVQERRQRLRRKHVYTSVPLCVGTYGWFQNQVHTLSKY